jgi:hypothetical protein
MPNFTRRKDTKPHDIPGYELFHFPYTLMFSIRRSEVMVFVDTAVPAMPK